MQHAIKIDILLHLRFFEQFDLHRQLFQMLINLHFLILGTKSMLSLGLSLVNIHTNYKGTTFGF